MDFIVDFLKAVFIERDKSKIKDSITTIAIVIVAFWIVKSYMDINDGIATNGNKIDGLRNYKVVVIGVADSIFTIKSIEITDDVDERLDEIIDLVHSLDGKRRQEIDYLIKYKDKSYQEIMDILKLNDTKWDYYRNESRVMMASETISDVKSLNTIEPLKIAESPVSMIDTIVPIEVEEIKIEPADSVSIDTTKKDNIFKRIFGAFKKKDD